MIIQNEPVSHDGGADLSFTVEAEDLGGRDGGDPHPRGSEIGIETDEAMGKVSIVGAGDAEPPRASPPRSSVCSARTGSTSR